jgi:carbon-monoxide dehydrogenase iron sulfur subunit
MTTSIAVQEKTPPARVARRWIAFDAQWCRTCRVCETMCAIAHEGAARPALARIRVTFDEFPSDVTTRVEEPAAARHFVSATVCLQCADAPCVEACPTRSLSRDARTGAILVDTDPDSERACTGCMRCRTACPWDVPVRHPERKVALKCDLCAGRAGGPVCVEMCPLSGKALRVEQGLSGDRSQNERMDAVPSATAEVAR